MSRAAVVVACWWLAAADTDVDQGDASLLQRLRGSSKDLEYKQVVLGAEGFNVTVFLPSAYPGDNAYYNSTRFDWSTQIGNIALGRHVLFGDSFWRGAAHDPTNPDAAVGLAAEFGCGEFGALCPAGTLNFAAGSANGVLGYDEAAAGEAFIKIGVGKLTKPAEEQYNPFSRYDFPEHPKWNVEIVDTNTVRMGQEISLDEKWGYRLNTSIHVEGSRLHLETELANIGSNRFSTPHYSHNFLSIDRLPIGPTWEMSTVPDADAKSEPGWGTWSTPFDDYFRVSGNSILANHIIPNDAVKVKACWIGPVNANASDVWSAKYSGVAIHSAQKNSIPLLYAYNIYAERATLSPEPIQMLSLASGERASWRRTIAFELEER